MTRRAIAKVTLATMAVTLLSGCATVMSGTRQTVLVKSYPPGAHVTMGGQTGITPVSLVADKLRDNTVRISQGPDTRVVILRRVLDPVALLNLIPPLWPGLYADWSSGAIWKFHTDAVMVDFRSAGPNAVQLTSYRR